ncbi:aldehyde reductase II [Teratosphaeria nubilosa]|uniref:Aldehyde reductase II n=1 Tax=Teratosphaeria nubilosa TaxID=161662 RepID=A0A6G1KZW0_9PEZI|nr:aldehyde reductase II [Teratosphaeria nubilosa]
MSTINKGDLVLVTDVNGYIASHVAFQFLEAGYRVRGTSRTKQKSDYLVELFEKKFGPGKFEVVEVHALFHSIRSKLQEIHDGAFDEAVKGVAGIAHVASVLTFSNKPDEVITPTVKGALNILTSASKEPGVKSFVYTSSSTAALLPQPNKEITVTKDTWNDETVRQVYESKNPDAFSVYGASKTEAEKAVWKVVKETNPPFQVSAVLPNWNTVAILDPNGAFSSSTASWINQAFTGSKDPLQYPPQYFIDVDDTARLHVIGIVDPAANGQRLFGFAEPFNWNDVFRLFREVKPDGEWEDLQCLGRDLSQAPNKAAEDLLRKHYGKGWTGLKESVKANVAAVKT